MNRIETISSYISKDDKVVDVGCDQAKLSLLLEKRNIPSIASDISENVINKAKETIKSNLIDLRVSDGLSNIKDGEADTLVLSGMGTHTILDIISKTNIRFKKIITISNNYHDILRNKMLLYNYIISDEEIIKENNKYYNLIVFKEGNTKYNDFELYFGLNHRNKELYKEYINYLKNKYIQIKKESKGKNQKNSKLLKLLKEKYE